MSAGRHIKHRVRKHLPCGEESVPGSRWAQQVLPHVIVWPMHERSRPWWHQPMGSVATEWTKLLIEGQNFSELFWLLLLCTYLAQGQCVVHLQDVCCIWQTSHTHAWCTVNQASQQRSYASLWRGVQNKFVVQLRICILILTLKSWQKSPFKLAKNEFQANLIHLHKYSIGMQKERN